jgi:hypothetical protein
MGRLYVIGGPQVYNSSTIYFVLQLMDHVTPSIENISWLMVWRRTLPKKSDVVLRATFMTALFSLTSDCN